MLEPKKEEKWGRERRSYKEILEPKKITKTKKREEAKESIGAKKERKRGVIEALMTLDYSSLVDRWNWIYAFMLQ